MKSWTMAALAAGLVAAGAFAVASAPQADAQTRAAVAPRALEILGGRESQIGVSIRDVDESDAKTGKAQTGGVVVGDVAGESPAEKAGIRKGDIVVEFDGERVRSARQFTRLVQETPPGRKIQAALVRDGQKMTVIVEPRESTGFDLLGDLDNMRVFRDFQGDFNELVPPPAPPAPPARPGTPSPPIPPAAPAFPDIQRYIWRSGNGLGLTVVDLSSQLADYFGTKEGVLVASVVESSAAAKAGIKAGDVVTSLNGNAVTSPSALRRQIQRLQNGEEFSAGIVRDKKPLTLKGKIETTRPRASYSSHAWYHAPAAWDLTWLRADGGPMSAESCAATIVAVASFAESLCPSPRISAAITPTQPAVVTSGAAIAPFETASAFTVWRSAVRNADAVAF
jgi:serine protease Do